MKRRRKEEKSFVRRKRETTTATTTIGEDNKRRVYNINIDMFCNRQQCKQCQVKHNYNYKNNQRQQQRKRKQIEEEGKKKVAVAGRSSRSPIMRITMGTPVKTSTLLLLLACSIASSLYLYCDATAGSGGDSAIKFNLDTNSYSGLTFTFDPRLDKRVEWLHFEHWLSIMQHSSSLLYDALNGRAHLAEIRVLIPYKWRHVSWPVLHKPGVPIITNRRLRFSDSDVIVGFEGKLIMQTLSLYLPKLFA